MENGFLALGGVVALGVVIINILAAVGVIKGDSKEKLANMIQTVVQIVLTLIGLFAPHLMDWFPMVDQAAELLAEIGGYVLLIIPLAVKFGNLFHDILAKVPVVDRTLGYQLSK